jgi:hypothetical protein
MTVDGGDESATTIREQVRGGGREVSDRAAGARRGADEEDGVAPPLYLQQRGRRHGIRGIHLRVDGREQRGRRVGAAACHGGGPDLEARRGTARSSSLASPDAGDSSAPRGASRGG